MEEGFLAKAHNFLIYFFNALLADVSLNADIERGMANFEPVVFLTLPFGQASFCFLHFTTALATSAG